MIRNCQLPLFIKLIQMKKTLFIFAILALGFSTLNAQTVTLPDAYKEAPDFRPDNQLQYLNAMAAMKKLTAGQLTAMAEKLQPYGSQTNTALQYALNGYAGYVMKPGREHLRKTTVQAYGQALSKVEGNMNKQFIIRQLQLMGDADAIKFLSPCLSDSFLSRSAAQALATIATPDAKQTLRAALQSANSANRIPLIEALGDCRDKKAVSLITAFAKSKNTPLKKVALYALASIGQPSSANVLLNAARDKDFQFTPANATSDCMLFIHRLMADGHQKAAKDLIHKLQKQINAEDNPGVYQAVVQFKKEVNGGGKQQPNTLSDAEQKAGFKLLFNGKNLDGWVGNKAGYKVDNGAIAVHPGHGSGGNLFTESEYSNFVFRFQFKLTPGANNGIGIRAPLDENAAYQGMEIQVLDNTAEKFNHLHLYQYHGSVYGVIPAKRGYLNPVGQWNKEEIRVNGTKIKVTLNGHVIVNGDIAPSIANGTMDHKDHPGLKNIKGHIGFLGHGSVVWFRDIRIRKLL